MDRTFRSSYQSFALLVAVLISAGAIRARSTATPTTPIKFLVVIFDENNSFDHYFGTYPNATNPPGEPQFIPLPNTPAINGLTPALLASGINRSTPLPARF